MGQSRNDVLRSVGGVPLSQGVGEPGWYFGWMPMNSSVDAYVRGARQESILTIAPSLAGAGVGKTVLLYEAVRKVWSRDLDPGPQLIGDCVSWGFAGCVDLVACVEVVAGEAEAHSWDFRTCTEAIYALSRVEHGNMDGSYNDGSYGAWAATAVMRGGTLSRHRLGPYDPQRAKDWGARGLPDALEAEAWQHRIRRTALVQSFAEARDSLANGYPVAVCSDQGFSLTRDADGFAAAEGTWYHCMKFIATRDDGRPGLLCMNSWGSDQPGGPRGKYDIPDGSFWVDADVCTRMLQQRDSYAISQFDGYPARSSQILAAFGR